MAQLIIDLTQAVVQPALYPSVVNATGTGSAIDMEQGEVALNAVVNVGACTGSGGAAVQIEECSTTNGTYTAISGLVFGASAITTNTQTAGVGLRTQRYVRYNVTALTATSFVGGITLVSQARMAQTPGYSRYPSS